MAAHGDIPDLCPNECDIGEDEDDDESLDWNEVETADEQISTCLFCEKTFLKIQEAIEHCKKEHAFDLVILKNRFDMDCYSFIKLINYIRKHHPESSFIMSAKECIWEKEEYMKPIQDDDPWLMHDYEDLDDSSFAQKSGNGFHVANAENGCVTLSEQHFAELQRTIQKLSLEVQEKDALMQNMLEDMERMRQVTQNLMKIGAGEELSVSQPKCVGNRSLAEDEGYFSTYAHFSIHHEMLSDVVRTTSYKKALMDNADTLKGKTILDLGCGTGILSMFAASTEAASVIGIDQENNLSDKITLVKGRLEDTVLPLNQVDVVVSEWMGYFLLFEAMLDSVIYARDHHMIKGGLLLPNRCSISLVGLADTVRHKELIGFWTDVYGYRMSCLQREVVREPTVEVVPQHMLVTTASVLTQIDLYTCTVGNLDFTSEFSLQVMRDESLTALVGYFDVFFDLPQTVHFSTGPHAAPTHWKQTVFFLDEPIFVKQGDTVTGKLICQRHQTEVRSLIITILLADKKYRYIMS
ncbi:Histone-arginine methyltransferase CARMER [Gryllus bimaculatus]|nr:Histone-arginine methyltransferase CARMER [Gryllus bimaculatus]